MNEQSPEKGSGAVRSVSSVPVNSIGMVQLEGNVLTMELTSGKFSRFDLSASPLQLHGYAEEGVFFLDLSNEGSPFSVPFFRHYISVDPDYRFAGLELRQFRPCGAPDGTLAFGISFGGIGIADIDDIDDHPNRPRCQQKQNIQEIFKLAERGPNGSIPCQVELSMSEQFPGALLVKFNPPEGDCSDRVFLNTYPNSHA